MKKHLIYVLTIILIVIMSFGEGYSQGIVRNVKLYIIPVGTHFKIKVPYNKVKDYATIKITLKEAKGSLENNDFLDLIIGLKSDSVADIAQDYRIVCVVHKIFGKEVLYFNTFGDFLYNGKTYKNDKIKSFVFNHIPENCK
ncbi:MAG: hypothetical protein PHY08_08335 [Candidatus Cloacimonetes bacterium]|nr:hypothetical protein [Candidatus Cloacimonadota bacterium]